MTVQQPTAEDMQERAIIDRSARFPVMFFFTSAAAWLFVGTLLGLFSSLKLSQPGLGDSFGIFGYGRIYPAHTIAMVYGWAMQAGIGVLIWLMARLTRNPVRRGLAILVAGHVWNAAVAVSIICVIIAKGRSIPWLDFPGWLWPLFAFSYALMVIWVIPMFHSRKGGPVYISEKFIVGAVIWFPWIFLTANFLIGAETAPVLSAGVDAWYISNLITFWMAPLTLAVAYYIVPKIAGRPLYSYTLASISFWVLAVLAGWTGFSRYMGGPFPSWMPAISGACSILLLLAIIAAVANIGVTLKGCSKVWELSPSLRFTVFGVLMLAVYALLAAASSTFLIGGPLQFTPFSAGLDTLAVYGFFSMSLFGAIYFIVPRITGAEWPSGRRIRRHFWFSAYGIISLIVLMLVGGIAHGGGMAVWNRPFSTLFSISTAYSTGLCVVWAMISFSNFWFMHQLGMMFIGKGRKSGGPTLIHGEPGAAVGAKEAAGITS